MAKARRRFKLYAGDVQIGSGVYYSAGGNVQLYLKDHSDAAWQLSSISEVLHIDGVTRFEWEN